MQTTGEAEFVNDIPWRANELHGAFVSSTVGNATIASVDPSAALVSVQYDCKVRLSSSKLN